jgi:glycosyltransferase involved in cell wall biosynthesis
MNPQVSIIIPTFNRPELLKRSMASVLTQTFTDFELIIVDDGDKVRSKEVAEGFHDPRVIYIANEPSRQGGGKSRNVGIARARGELVAFQDDDDEWFPEKLAIQIGAFKDTPEEVGFCFTAVINDFGNEERTTKVRDGVYDYRDIALRRFAGFLTVTLLFRKSILIEMGGFDETLPSHQEPELMIRVTRKYKGLGINQPLARVNATPHEHVGSSFARRIEGREIILKKHHALIAEHPDTLAYHYFQLGLWCRDSGNKKKAKAYFWSAFRLSRSLRHLAHYCWMSIV